MSGTLRERKTRLRRELAARRRAFAPAAAAAASRRIARRLAALGPWRRAKGIVFYHPLPGEVDVRGLLAAALAARRPVFLPRCRPGRRELEVRRVSREADLAAGSYGIREPEPARCPLAAPGDFDLVLVPGVAFDAAGRRLGRGAGYYDRFLAGLPAGVRRLAAAFSWQVLEEVPAGRADEPVHLIVTEAGIIRPRPRD